MLLSLTHSGQVDNCPQIDSILLSATNSLNGCPADFSGVTRSPARLPQRLRLFGLCAVKFPGGTPQPVQVLSGASHPVGSGWYQTRPTPPAASEGRSSANQLHQWFLLFIPQGVFFAENNSRLWCSHRIVSLSLVCRTIVPYLRSGRVGPHFSLLLNMTSPYFFFQQPTRLCLLVPLYPAGASCFRSFKCFSVRLPILPKKGPVPLLRPTTPTVTSSHAFRPFVRPPVRLSELPGFNVFQPFSASLSPSFW